MPVEVVGRPSRGEGRTPGVGLGEGCAVEVEGGNGLVRRMLRLRKDIMGYAVERRVWSMVEEECQDICLLSNQQESEINSLFVIFYFVSFQSILSLTQFPRVSLHFAIFRYMLA